MKANEFPKGLEPALVWKHFDHIRSIPHGSGDEAAIRAHVIEWATARGFSHTVDASGNVLVRIPATPGLESRKTTVLQGHLDMVCEKNSDVAFDFEKDPLQVQLVGDDLMAIGTTLGADNGVGVACAMALAEDPEAVHGPLEILCTVDEETGLTGARGLQAGFLTGARMLNLDTEEEGYIYVGCAGGGDVQADFALEWMPAPEHLLAWSVDVRGLVGGHSGCDIHLNRANAIKCLARTLNAIRQTGLNLRLLKIEGGSKRNAIPREASAVLALDADATERIEAAVKAAEAVLRKEFAATDPELSVQANPLRLRIEKTLCPSLSHAIIDAILASPSSVIAMSRDVPGLVETSNNIGVVRMTASSVQFVNCSRSSLGSALENVRQSLAALYRLAGATVVLEESYPGWQPDLSSALLARAREVFAALFDKEAQIAAVHAGLECGLIGEHFPGMEMISIGPDIRSPHSPIEKVNVPSVQRFYTYLRVLLAQLD